MRMALHGDIKRSIVKVMTSYDGSIPSDTLLSLFEDTIKANGFIDKVAYAEFHKVLKEVAIQHESAVFGRTWILRKPPRRV